MCRLMVKEGTQGEDEGSGFVNCHGRGVAGHGGKSLAVVDGSGTRLRGFGRLLDKDWLVEDDGPRRGQNTKVSEKGFGRVERISWYRAKYEEDAAWASWKLSQGGGI